MEVEKMQQNRSSSWLPWGTNESLPISSPWSSPPPENGRDGEKHDEASPDAKAPTTQLKHGGWRAMPSVLGLGLMVNFSIFLLTVYGLEQILIWPDFGPLPSPLSPKS
nr:protein NRT1/ PTR FAMILY 2.13-like [Ipomoea batatas]